MDNEGNKLFLLTTSNLYPRIVRTVLTVIGSLLLLGPTLDTEGWSYLWSTPTVILGLLLVLLQMLLTGKKPGDK